MIAFIGAAGLIEIPDLLFRDAIVIATIAILMIIYGILQMLGLSLFWEHKVLIILAVFKFEFIKVFAKDKDDNDDDSSLMSEIESSDGITVDFEGQTLAQV